MTMAAAKFSPDDRLNRKRQAARIRQQRCRARKRALAAAAVHAVKNPDVAPSRVMIDGSEVKLKGKTQQRAKVLPMSRPVPVPYHKTPGVMAAASNDPHTTVDGVRMSKRAAVHAALLDEHNRKFFAQVEAERKNGARKDNKTDSKSARAPMSHMVVNSSHAPNQPGGTPTRTHSPMHPSYYRHGYPHGAYYAYPPNYGPRPHGKYSAPPPVPPHHQHPAAYPHSPPPAMYRSTYDGRYHPIPPHALPHPTRHFPPMAPPQASVTESSTAPVPTTTTDSVPATVSHSVSDDDRSTPTQDSSPSVPSDEEASYHSMDHKEQEAIAAMLTLSSASTEDDVETKAVNQTQRPLVMSQ